MREIEDRITAWREEIAGRGGIDRTTARELESHLREAIDAEMADGADPVEAFDTSATQLGPAAELGAEFDKVYPEVSWSRRMLWLVTGHGFVALVLLISNWAYYLVSTIAMRIFPTAMVELPNPVTFERDEEHILYTSLPEEAFTATHLHTSMILGFAARLLVVLALIVLVVRIVRRTPSWFSRLVGDNKRLTVTALILCGIQILMSHHWFARMFHRLLDTRSSAYEETLGKVGMGRQELNAIEWWAGERVVWVWCALLFGLAFWALAHVRRSEEGGPLRWTFAGYFVISGVGSLLGVLGMMIALAAGHLFPGLHSNSTEMLWLQQFYLVHSHASVVMVSAQLILFVGLLIGCFLIIVRRRFLCAERVGSLIARHSVWLLAIWLFLFGVPRLWGQYVQDDIVQAIFSVTAQPSMPKGAWMSALIVAVTILGAWRGRPGPEKLRGGIA